MKQKIYLYCLLRNIEVRMTVVVLRLKQKLINIENTKYIGIFTRFSSHFLHFLTFKSMCILEMCKKIVQISSFIHFLLRNNIF